MTNQQITELLCVYASQFIGKSYLWGGDDPILGFDCSGLIQECLASIGADPAHDQNAQMLYEQLKNYNCRPQGGSFEQGDLVFFGESLDQITHVALMVNNFQMLEAGGGGPSITDSALAAKANAFIRIRPVMNRKDFVGSLTLDYCRIIQDKHLAR